MSLNRLFFLLAVLFMTTLPSPPAANAENIGFIEKYALATDRQAMLDQLIPGSEEYFFYHCLHFQVTGELNRAETFLAEWESKIRNDSAQRISIRDRQRLLTYESTPDRTIEYLRNRLSIRLDHSAPPKAGERRWQDSLDQNLIDPETLIGQASRVRQNLSQVGLQFLANNMLDGRGANYGVDLTWLTQQINGRWYPRLGELVIAELRSRRPEARQFGDRAAHGSLTLSELQKVLDDFPELANSDELIGQILLRMQPNDDSNPSEQPDVRFDYLTQINAFVQGLPASQNSLKAATLYRLLEASQNRGEFPLQEFLAYLKLPRQSPIIYVDPRFGGRQPAPSNAANLSADFSRFALLPPIGDERPLVRAYLEHFLRDAASTTQFDGLVEQGYLTQVFAETKLLYGVGQPQRWYDMLNTDERTRLNERVELTLSETNPRIFPTDIDATISLDVKGVEELIVRVYEINSQSYYRTHNEPIDTNVDLDGLVATEELRIEYDFPKVRRHREQIALPGVTGRGVWVVDFLGGGLRSRAIIRRGDLRFIERISANGQVFVVLDQDRNPVPEARMLVAGREWLADDDGRITLPLLPQPLTRQAVLMDDEIAIPVLFAQYSESYNFTASMRINRQQLQAGQMADLVIRPRLAMSGTLVDPSMVEKVTVVITGKDQDGIETNRRFENLKLSQASETVVRFRVPNRLSALTATLTGQITIAATGRQTDLATSESWNVNGVQQTSNTMDAYLTLAGEQWIAEVRGLNGEPISGAAVNVSMQTIYREMPVQATLQTNVQGRITLGQLNGVQRVDLSVGGNTISRELNTAFAQWPERLHGIEGEMIQLPVADPGANVEQDFRLLSLRDRLPTQDLTDDHLSLESGLLSLQNLSAGDYLLYDRQQGYFQSTKISITAGPIVANVAAGKIRNLDLAWPTPVSIASIAQDDQGLRIQLSGDFSVARVHVLGSRYLSPDSGARLPLPNPGMRAVNLAQSGYVSDLRLGDEYLYVLRRQYAKKYPGVMLPSPSLLIAPWVTDETSNNNQIAGAGEAVPESANRPAPSAAADGLERHNRAKEGASLTQSLEFLPTTGTVLANLVPDENGRIDLSQEQLGDLAIIEIVVVDPISTLERTVAGKLNELKPEDRRLANPLPSDKSFAFQREVLVAGPNQPLPMASIGTAQIQVYAELGEILQLYRTISGDARLDQFKELGSWNTLDDAAKRTAYGRLACHELHVFLKYKDPQFFDAVVKPYLENKKEKKLVDQWLLGNDLTPWTELWQYSQLNAFEKAILAKSVPNIRETVLRELRERIAMQQVDPAALRQLIEFGLAGKAMEETDGLTLMLSTTLQEEAEATSDFGDVASDAFGFALPEAPAGMGGGMGGYAAPADAAKSESRMQNSAKMRGGRGIPQARRLGRTAEFFFQPLDSTKQWADNHWDHVRVAQANESLIPVDAFWQDWANAESVDAVLSKHLLQPTSNRHSALIALALLDLPFESEGVELPSEPDATYKPNQSVAIITKRLRTLESSDEQASLLVGQRFERTGNSDNDPFGANEIKIAPDEFLTNQAYTGQIVLTNPTPQSRTVDVLWQVPAGSLPLAGSQATDSKSVRIEPFEVQRIEYQFYFPAAGTFRHYPVCISSESTVVARGQVQTFDVVEQPTTMDEASWQQVALVGTAEKISAFLSNANLRKLDFSLVTHRLQDRAIYDVVIGWLEKARIWQPELWAYAFLYRDQDRMTSYLENRQDLVQSVGPVLRSNLLVVEPISRAMYEHLEYAPLVRARIHSLRTEPEILNDQFLGQYRSLMQVIAYQSKTSADQQLALAYYLLLQNRIEEAIHRFDMVTKSSLEMTLQYDYMAAYLALQQGNYQRAGELAGQYASHPVPRWRERFTQIELQLKQRRDLQSGMQLVGTDNDKDRASEGVREDAADLATMDRERRQAEGAQASPDVAVRVEGDQLVIDHRNVKDASLRFYGIDLELLFSKTPFVRDGLERMATVRPMRTETITLGTGDGTARFPLGEALARQTLLVEIVADGARDTTLYYGGKLKTYTSEGFGQLQVSDRSTGDPVATAYVKVYSRDKSGSVQFYKDGYTDLRGRFDYATLSTGNLSQIDKFAILVLDPERGATLHEVNPPTK